MKFLLFTLLFAVSAQILPRIEENYEAARFKGALYRTALEDEGGDAVDSSRFVRDPLIGDSPSPIPSRSEFRRRFFRNTGDPSLKSLLARLQMIARLTNAIYIHRGLTTGSIPPGDLIPELLHLGHIKTSLLTGVNSGGVQDAVTKILKNLPTQLEAGTEVTEAEKALADIEKIVKALDGVEGPIQNRDVSEFGAMIEKLSTTDIEIGGVSDLSNQQTKWGNFKTLSDTDPNPDNLNTYFGDLKIALDEVKTTKSKLNAAGRLWRWTSFKSASDALAPSLKISTAATLYGSSTKTNHWSDYSSFMNKFLENIAPLKSTLLDLNLVHDSLKAHHSLLLHNFTHSHGLPNGAPDLARMLDDLNGDAWLKSVVKTDLLVTAFSSLKTFEMESRKVYQSLGGQVLADLKPLVSVVETLSGLEKDAILRGIQALSTLTTPDPTSLSWPSNLESEVTAVDTSFGELQEKVDELLVAVSVPELVEMCDAVIAICDEAKDAADRTVQVTNFNNYAKKAELKTQVDAIYKLVGEINTARGDIQTKALVVKDRMDDLTTFHTELGEVGGYFDGLLAISGLKSVLRVLPVVENMRKIDQPAQDSYSTGSEVVKKVVALKETFEKMEKSVGEMKGASNPETDALELLKDPGRHSKTIGSAVRGIGKMESAMEKKSEVDSIVAGFDVVNKSLDSVVSDVSKMYTSFDVFQKSVTVPNSATLADLFGTFQKAKSVTGITGDLQKLSADVEKLKEVEKDNGKVQKLEKVQESLATLDSMGLEFSRYHKDFDGSKDSLVALDTFFVDYLNKLNSLDKLGGEKESSSLLTFIAIALFTVLVAILAVHLVLFFCKRDTFFKIYKCCRRKVPGAAVTVTADLFELILNQLMDIIKRHGEFHGYEGKTEEERREDNWYSTGWTYLFSMDDVYVANEALHSEQRLTEYRFDIPLLESTRVVLTGYGNRFINDLYHANIFKLPNNRELVLAQGPQKASEGKNSTIEKFWWMAKQKGSKAIAMLCQLTERGEVQCDEYFPDKAGEFKEFGDLRVDCLDKMIMLDGRLEIRKLKGKFGNEKDFSTTHYSFNGYGRKTYPDFPDFFAQFMKKVLNEPGTTIVHCSNGTNRTGTFALSAYLIYNVVQTKEIDMKAALVALRDSRIGCIQNSDDYAFSSVVMFEYMADGIKIKKEKVKEDYTDMKMRWQVIHVERAREESNQLQAPN
ncbi:hypothetical protein GCK72_003324 [Caenorhabditis remanei]|uniref:Tyrosine-protein phosphatase domain-containing protein n=1 Tax=Caenorhabditis remanei TaxID=31234 RepID=A0A6A5HY11_CAERE|nr:hypothetical protein GCK72_003324 [Caenorhabditis remanei]KAF1771497.1 hypothetical protein GCK72_003324 [Caenorhabditis remanei]